MFNDPKWKRYQGYPKGTAIKHCVYFICTEGGRQHKEPCFEGSYKQIQIDEFWTFVKHRKAGKRWVWYAYDKEKRQVLAFQIGKRDDNSCKALLKKLEHLNIESYCTDDWKSYEKYLPKEKHIISKAKTTHIERWNRDLRTHIKRLTRETVCFSKKDDMHYEIIKTYIHHKNAA